MTSTTETAQPPAEHADLARFGYTQELHRRVGSFASFAAGFSYVSILTTVFQLFFLGYGFGGAAFFWTWPVVFFGQLLVALNFSTLAARFPISGAIFQWSSRLAGQTWGWFTGWVMIIGQVLTVAAAAIALQAVLPWAWLASGLMAAYVMVGFDSAGELSEETRAPRRITPRTIIRALVVSGVGGALLLIAALMAAPSLTDGNLASVGLPYVVVYQVVAIVNLAWPRKSVYDLTGHTWWLQWSAVLFIALTLVAGYLVHLRLRGGKVHIPHARHHQPATELATELATGPAPEAA